jgi:hypothetical protein
MTNKKDKYGDSGCARMTSKNGQRQGQEQRPGAKARFFDGDGIAQAKAWAYLRNKSKNKNKYGDSGCARMTSKNRQRQGRRPGAKARFFDGDGIAQAKAWAYLRNKSKSKDKYGDSGCARMTSKNGQRQEQTTTKTEADSLPTPASKLAGDPGCGNDKQRDKYRRSFDCVWRKCAKLRSG